MIGKRISKNMVVIGLITTIEQFISECEGNRSIYHTNMGMKPARVFACMQFDHIARQVHRHHFYSIIHYKSLQCDPPKKRVRTAKPSCAPTKKQFLRSLPITDEHTATTPKLLPPWPGPR